MKSIKYGASKHYEGDTGRKYFTYQNRSAEAGSRLNARKFHKYIQPDSRVLDFGCGGGWLLRSIHCGVKVGVEINDAAREVCLKNGILAYRSTSEIPEGGFDVIISHHCLEHVPYPIDALCSLRDLLKDDGLLVLVLPIDDWRAQLDFSAADIDHHLHTWTPRLLANTLSESGFRIDSIVVATHAWFRYWERCVKWLPMPVFDWLCWIWSIVRKNRQLIAVARRGSQ